MKVDNVTKWMVIDHQASSLFDVIAGGKFTATSAGRAKWLSLMASSALQGNCNKEGFNIYNENTFGVYGLLFIKQRIGIVGNNENTCSTPDSCLGFGTSVGGCNGDVKKSTCGNMAFCGHLDNRDNAAFGFIFVQ